MGTGARRSIRLPGYDYSASGAYFVTVCTDQRQLLFTDPVLHDLVTSSWQKLVERFSDITLDEFIVMPNHVHFIIWLNDKVDPEGIGTSKHISLSNIVGTWKSIVAVTYLQWIKQHDPERPARVWQRNYYEHVIRNESELNTIRDYIRDNPVRWAEDRDNLDALIVRMEDRS